MKMNNNMVCDVETGVCGPSGEDDSAMEVIDFSAPKQTVDLYYVTDPICSHCWALEPVLRKFIDQYGNYFNMHTIMGGLLEKWDGFADQSNSISGPNDVAHHWREVGEHSRMPIDGTLWHHDPVSSSFIPSRVYKMIQAKDEGVAIEFLRRAREALFAWNKNIANNDVLIMIVNELGLDGEQVVQQANQTEANRALEQDFKRSRELGVRGFPTIVMVNEEQQGVRMVGARALEDYKQALQQVLPEEEIQASEVVRVQQLLHREKLLFSREIEEYYSIEQSDVASFMTKELGEDAFETNEILGEVYYKQT